MHLVSKKGWVVRNDTMDKGSTLNSFLITLFNINLMKGRTLNSTFYLRHLERSATESKGRTGDAKASSTPPFAHLSEMLRP